MNKRQFLLQSAVASAVALGLSAAPALAAKPGMEKCAGVPCGAGVSAKSTWWTMTAIRVWAS